MNLRISAIDHNTVYKKFGKDLRKSRVAITKENTTDTKYLSALYEDNPIAVVGFCYMSKSHVRFKTDYVNKAFRGKKIYSDLWKERILLIFKDAEVQTISAYCTEMSLPKYLKEGFIEQSKNSKGITYLKKQK